MASIWERFSQFVKGSNENDLGYYEEETTPESASPAPPVRTEVAAPPVAGTPKPIAPPSPKPIASVVPPTYRVPEAATPNQPVTTQTVPARNPELPDTAPAGEPAEKVPALPEQETTRMSLYPESAPLTIPYWLEDEDTLRDEGVLFGLSESDPTEKTDIIHNYFIHLAANHERNIEQQNERVQELNLFIGQKENRIEELNGKLKALEGVRHEGEHQLPRTLVGLALSIAMCVGNYFLIEETLRPSFSSSSYVALGVFLAGMFNLFGRISLFHDTDSNVSWRRLLEEVGMPLAASLFVFAQAWQTQSGWQAVSLFVFVFFLFLFAGKLFLSNITVLRNDLRIWLTTRRGRREVVDNSQEWEDEIVELNEEIDKLRVQKWQVLREQGTSESERDRLYARRDMLIKLFESEFYLARKMRGRLSDRQLREIRGS
jgi:hypothetical protein